MLDDLKFMNVSDLMQGWPETVPVFVKHHMACPGCVMAPFMTVREVAAEYGIPEDGLATDLARVMANERWEDRV
ncbi:MULTISPECIES: DUF1858 domain-containing protein [Hyphobacterium]|uniref:DUF1858 domain-containing protein n=1 Tax=Hyphobacterium vulgare TaxID=1736751 RepID=A0ABV6ZX90_9PROT